MAANPGSRVVAARVSVVERRPVRIVELRGADRIGRWDRLVHDLPRKDRLRIADGPHAVLADRHEVRCRGLCKRRIVIALEMDAGGGDMRRIPCRIERTVAADRFPAEEVVAVDDFRREFDHQARLLLRHAARKRLAVVPEFGQRVQVFHDALLKRRPPILVAALVGVDAVELMAKREPRRVVLRIVDPKARLKG